MNYKVSDFKKELINLHFDVFVHGCNLQGAFAAGVAGIVREVYPECCEVYAEGVASGEYSGGHVLPYEICENKVILNAFTQILPGKNGSYDLIDKAFSIIGRVYSGNKICYPLIGCGIAGLNWSVVKEIIDHRLNNEDHNCIVRLDDIIQYKLMR
jgi:O-acetyl-ADP-ribose deacetylase (regulator of RNase III)